jgi:NAD(P)H-flavin reductase
MGRILLKIHGSMCDLTEYMNQHPGGREILERAHAQDEDATAAFERFGHSENARSILMNLMIDKPEMEDVPVTSAAMGSSTKTLLSRVRQKLYTNEDYRHVHKLLGMLSVLHIIPRMLVACIYGSDVVVARVGPTTRTILVLIQLLLSVSSLQFRLPITSNIHKPVIHSMVRAHSIVFAIRAVLCTLCLIWLGMTRVSTVLRSLIVIGTMFAADRVTQRLADPTDNFKTTRSTPYWPGIDPRRRSIHKAFYAYAQFGATLVCLGGSHSEVIVLSTLVGIQGAMFGTTLVRKSLIQTYTYHMVYTTQLLTTVVLGLCTQSVQLTGRQVALVGLLYTIRIRWSLDKYLLWGSVATCMLLSTDGIHVPSLCVVGAACVAGRVLQQPMDGVDIDPNSRVLSIVQTGGSHCRMIIRTRDVLAGFKPGQFVTISNGVRTRKYTPLSVVPHGARQSQLDMAIRRYPKENALSDYLYGRSIDDIVLIDGPFGTQYYDESTRILHADRSPGIDLEPGTDMVVLISGGSGVAPMYSLAGAMLASGIGVVLVTADTTEEGALLRMECRDLVVRYGDLVRWETHVSVQGTRLQRSDLVDYASCARVVCVCGPSDLTSFVRDVLPATVPLLIW